MPELPEMQGLAERLSDLLAGATFTAAQPLQFSALKTVQPSPADMEGRQVTAVSRRGKYCLIELGGPRIAFHLSQGGRVDVEDPPKSTRPKPGVVRFAFADRPSVLVKEFGTERKAGWWVLAEGDEGPMEGLGPDPFSDEFEAWLLGEEKDGRRVHTALRDQRTVAGVGRGHTDDALHRAKLSPYASVKSLTDADRRRLLAALRSTLEESLAKERQREGGLPTKLGDRWIVHNRSGEPCPVCHADLRRVSYESYEVTYCPVCQTDGKVLADRRMSRLLK